MKDQHKKVYITSIYSINFTQLNKRFVLSLRYNGSKMFLFVDIAKIYQFKAKDTEIKNYTLCLGNIAKDFTVNNMEKNRIERNCKFSFCSF